MRFRFALISGFLFASAVLAKPDTSSFPRGGVLLESEKNGTFLKNGATFSIPSVHPGPRGITNDTQINAAMAYAAIDVAEKDRCISSLAVGVSFIVCANGTEYQSWYHWEAGTITNFENISISAQDTVTVGIIAPYQSSHSALMWVHNERNGEYAQSILNSTTEICGSSIGWFIGYVPDPRYDPGYPIANFGEVTFSNATAFGSGEQTYGPQSAGAFVTELVNGDDGGERTVALTVVEDASTVTFEYVYDP